MGCDGMWGCDFVERSTNKLSAGNFHIKKALEVF